MKRHVLKSALMAGSFLLAACERLPDEIVYVTGTLVDENGAPRSGEALTLLFADDFCEYGKSYDSNGNPLPPKLEELRQTQTNEKGEFVFEALIGELHPRRDEGACLAVVGGSPETGRFEASFLRYIEDGDAVFGTVMLARSPATLDVQPDGTLRLSGKGPIAAPLGGQVPGLEETLAAYRVHPWSTWEVWQTQALVNGRQVGYPIWLSPRSGGEVTFEPELLEDYADLRGWMALREVHRREEGISPVEEIAYLESHAVRLTTPAVNLPAGTRAPVSRGRPCKLGGITPMIEDDDGGATEYCPLTDGVLEDSPYFGRFNVLDFSFETPILPRKLVVRAIEVVNLEGPLDFVVSGSRDGLTYEPLGRVPVHIVAEEAYGSAEAPDVSVGRGTEAPALAYVAATLNTPQEPLLHVRVQFEAATEFFISNIGEVSIFE